MANGGRSRPPGRRGGAGWLLAAIAFGVLVLGLMVLFPDRLHHESTWMRLVHLFGLVVLIGAGVVAMMRAAPRRGLRDAAIWLAIGALLILIYGIA